MLKVMIVDNESAIRKVWYTASTGATSAVRLPHRQTTA